MGDARALTPLSQADYDAIEAAVMETARGRWFMTEYAKRNRQADTLQLLESIQRIERVVGVGLQASGRDDNLTEAAELIGDLRADLERISGKANGRGSGLAAQMESAADTIIAATENIQEAAWALREAGGDEELCNRLDQRSAEISSAIGIVDGLVQRVDKIADTIAMLDTSLRVFSEISRDGGPEFEASATDGDMPVPAMAAAHQAQPESRHAILEDEGPLRLNDEAAPETRIGSVHLLDDDIVFDDAIVAPPPLAATATATSEAALREIDSFTADRKLAYFV